MATPIQRMQLRFELTRACTISSCSELYMYTCWECYRTLRSSRGISLNSPEWGSQQESVNGFLLMIFMHCPLVASCRTLFIRQQVLPICIHNIYISYFLEDFLEVCIRNWSFIRIAMSMLHRVTADFVQLLMITITSELRQTNHNFLTSSGTPIILECQQRLFFIFLSLNLTCYLFDWHISVKAIVRIELSFFYLVLQSQLEITL